MGSASAVVRALADQRDALVREVTERLLDRHPELRSRFGESGVRATREDLASHLDTLSAALDAAEPELFATYARWLASVLAPRGVPVAMLTESFTALADACRARLPDDAARAVAEVLDRGVAALAGEGGETVAGGGAAAGGAGDGDGGTAAGRSPGGGAAAGAPPEDALVRLAPESLIDPDAVAQALIDGRYQRIEQLLDARLARGAYLDLAVNVLQPALYEVGRRWQTNRIGVADEHLATSTALHALTTAYVRAEAQPPNGRRAVFACVEHNLHDLGVHILADAFELAGWQADALGADTPTRELVAFVRDRRPHLLGLSISLPRQLASGRDAIAAVREALGDDAPTIVVGGLAANQLVGADQVLGADATFPDARRALEAP